MNTRKIAELLIRHRLSLAKYKGIYSYEFTLLVAEFAKQYITENKEIVDLYTENKIITKCITTGEQVLDDKRTHSSTRLNYLMKDVFQQKIHFHHGE